MSVELTTTTSVSSGTYTGTYYPNGDPIPGWTPYIPPAPIPEYHYHYCMCGHDTAAIIMLLERIQKLEDRIKALESQ